MGIIKKIIYVIILCLLSFGAFGGFGVIAGLVMGFLEVQGQTFDILFYLCTFAPMPFCWVLVPKIFEKF